MSINKEWFVCNNDDINCIIEPQEEGEQISFEGLNSRLYTQCTSDGECPFVNDAGFNIEVTGNSPTSNTIPAQVNTEQQVDIGSGSFSATEELFSDRFVPNAIFDVENIPVGNIEGLSPIFVIAFDEAGQRVFTANGGSNSVSIIDLRNNSVTDVPLDGGNVPRSIIFDAAGQRVFTANSFSDSVSIIEFPTINRICQNSGFDTGDIRTFESNGEILQQITCVNFVGECSGNIDNGETRECTVENYVVSLDEVPSDGNGIGILSNIDKPQQQNQLFTNDIPSTGNKIKTQALPTGPFIYDVPKH